MFVLTFFSKRGGQLHRKRKQQSSIGIAITRFRFVESNVMIVLYDQYLRYLNNIPYKTLPFSEIHELFQLVESSSHVGKDSS